MSEESERNWEVVMENIQFLTSPEGGSLSIEAAAVRLGVGLPGLSKRWGRHQKKLQMKKAS